MRKFAVLALAIVLSMTYLAAQAKPAGQAKPAAPAAAASSGNVGVTWKCAAPNPANAIPVTDAPGHAYVVEQVACTAARGEIAGVKNKDGLGVEFMEVKGDSSTGHGVFVETLANGDKIVYSYTGKGTGKDGKLVSGSNSWTATSGTGKFKGITAKGTCKAKGNPDGSAVFECTGTYSLK